MEQSQFKKLDFFLLIQLFLNNHLIVNFKIDKNPLISVQLYFIIETTLYFSRTSFIEVDRIKGKVHADVVSN